jgi:hypothetical protein
MLVAAALVVPGCGGDAREGVPFESLSGVPGVTVEAALIFAADGIAQRFPQGAFPQAVDVADVLTPAGRSGSLDFAGRGVSLVGACEEASSRRLRQHGEHG